MQTIVERNNHIKYKLYLSKWKRWAIQSHHMVLAPTVRLSGECMCELTPYVMIQFNMCRFCILYAYIQTPSGVWSALMWLRRLSFSFGLPYTWPIRIIFDEYQLRLCLQQFLPLLNGWGKRNSSWWNQNESICIYSIVKYLNCDLTFANWKM